MIVVWWFVFSSLLLCFVPSVFHYQNKQVNTLNILQADKPLTHRKRPNFIYFEFRTYKKYFQKIWAQSVEWFRRKKPDKNFISYRGHIYILHTYKWILQCLKKERPIKTSNKILESKIFNWLNRKSFKIPFQHMRIKTSDYFRTTYLTRMLMVKRTWPYTILVAFQQIRTPFLKSSIICIVCQYTHYISYVMINKTT